jgi:PAS domain S-box-containing protein
MSWAYSYDPEVWPSLVTAVVVAILGWYGWQRRSFPGAKPFTIFCLFAFLWAAGSVFEIQATDFSTKIGWIKFQAVWQIPTATALPWFVLEYAGFNRWLTRRNLALMVIPAILTLLLIITNNYHHLIWIEFRTGEPVTAVLGIANWILLAYASLLIIITIIILCRLAARSPVLRWPAIYMLFGIIIGIGFYALSNINISLLGPGERVFFILGVLSLSFSLAFFRFRVLDPLPLAYSAIFKQMQAGVLVLDRQGKILEINPAAGQIVGGSRESWFGHSIAEAVPEGLKILSWLEKPETAPAEFSLAHGASIRYYSPQITQLKDRRIRTLGYLLFFMDTTEQRQTQARILEQKKVVATLEERERLARELHDSIGQVLGYVQLQAQTIRKLMRSGKNEEAEPEFTNLLEAARDAHTDVRESILNLKAGTGEAWSFVPVLRRYLKDYQAHHGIKAELAVPEDLKDNTFDSGAGVQLLRVIQEALTNARKHSRATTVKINITLENMLARISVTDNGMGFDTGLTGRDSSGHFGLTFMQERMEQIGGKVVIVSHSGKGTTVNLETPIRNQEEQTQ